MDTYTGFLVKLLTEGAPLSQVTGAPLPEFAALVLVLFFGIGVHEYCHAKFADMAGDPTPGIHGRVTLNLFKHFDPLGAVLLIYMAWSGFGFGWGKPVPVDPSKMKNPRMDFFISVAAGPISNLLQAVVYGLVFRVLVLTGTLTPGTFVYYLVFSGVLVNLTLFLFNLIPLGPLDGAKIVGTMLPEDVAIKWYRFNYGVGTFIFMGLILFGLVSQRSVFSHIIIGPLEIMARLILGVR